MNKETKIPDNVRQFYNTYKPYALITEQQTGISHLFILAQAALESGWGAHAPGNMFFGVKATAATPENERQLLVTTEVFASPSKGGLFPEVISIKPLGKGQYLYVVKAWFRKYATPADSFTHHAELLLNQRRYADALKVKSNPYLFAEAIARAGYATDPQYAEKLKHIIRMLEMCKIANVGMSQLASWLVIPLVLVGCRAKKEVRQEVQQLRQVQVVDTLQQQWQHATGRQLSTVEVLTMEVDSCKDSVGHHYFRLKSVRQLQAQQADTAVHTEAHHQIKKTDEQQLSTVQYTQKRVRPLPYWLWWLLAAMGVLALLKKNNRRK